MPSSTVHQAVRSLLGWYPWRTPAYELNVFFSWIGFDRIEPQWLERQPEGDLPGIKLDVSRRYHRKMFYFLKSYFHFAKRGPLGQFLRATLTPGGTFLDIGAHIGFFSFLASQLVGADGHVFAFEPDPHTIESLQGSVALNGGRVQIVPFALSDRPGKLTFYRAGPTAHSLIPGNASDDRYTGEQVTVDVTTLDRWAATAEGLDPPRIQAMKIDVEGVEAEVLRGGLDLLAHANRPPIWCEVRGPHGSTRAPGTFEKVLSVLSPLGYRAYRWHRGDPQEVTVADVDKREDILFRA